MNKIIKNKIGMNWLALIISISLVSSGCRKLVETDPPTDRLTGSNVFLADGTAIAVFNNIYRYMGYHMQGGSGVSVMPGLSADELTLFSNVTVAPFSFYYKNELVGRLNGSTSTIGGEYWNPFFRQIFLCNDAIDGLNKSTKLTPAVKQQLLGEAKFIRAFYYFYLLNFFGDVPLALTTDPLVNTSLRRSSKENVYDQIITDLKEAEELLSNNFLDITLTNTTTERVRPTKWAASALLARVYLYKGDWTKAEEKANAVISNSSLFGPLPSLNNVFLKNSREAIWQLQPTDLNLNTGDGQAFIIPSTGPGSFSNPASLSMVLLNSFETTDNRAVLGNWVNKVVYNVGTGKDSVYFVYKYKKDAIASGTVSSPGAMSEYFMVLRLGEQYLIRAEARAHMNNNSGSQSDLNAIRNRAGLPNTTAADQPSLFTAILNERRHELFCEWGHRWLDLKRTGKVDEVMNVVTPIKSNAATNWQPYQALYPIPYTEMQLASNLIQNPGY